MIIKCTKCGYTKAVMESELMESTDCELCGGKMILSELANYLAEQEKEIPANNIEEQKESNEGNASDSAGIKENIENQLVTRMIMEIEQYGEAGEWKRINTMDLESRLLVMEIFIEAKQRIIEGLK